MRKWNTFFIETRTTIVRGGGVDVHLVEHQEHMNTCNSSGWKWETCVCSVSMSLVSQLQLVHVNKLLEALVV